MGTRMVARRMKRELELLSRGGGTAPGISAWPRENENEQRFDILDAEICGAADTPYEGGIFRLEIHLPDEYPLKPPRVRFVTPIYHPNIDTQGRICLDSLTMPPKGAWKPSLNISTLLTTIQALMSSPNPDDGLMVDITDEYRRNPALFKQKARNQTLKHAVNKDSNNNEGKEKENENENENDDEIQPVLRQSKSNPTTSQLDKSNNHHRSSLNSKYINSDNKQHPSPPAPSPKLVTDENHRRTARPLSTNSLHRSTNTNTNDDSIVVEDDDDDDEVVEVPTASRRNDVLPKLDSDDDDDDDDEEEEEEEEEEEDEPPSRLTRLKKRARIR